jgi:lysyl endopeptidase
MLPPLSRFAGLALLTTAISANAQLSVPPATYRPATPTKAQVEPALLLPTDAAARSILLSTPTSSERGALTPKLATGTSKDGIVPKRGRLIIGFAREVPAAQGSVNLSDLAWAQAEGGTQAAHISLTSPGAAAIRIGLVLTAAPAALEMRFKGSSSTAQVFGPYPAELAHESIYWSPVLEGETGIIELTLPAGVSPGAGMLSLPMISHLVVAGNALRQADPLGEIGQSGACEVDVACMSTTLKQQAASAVNAVARMVFTDRGQTGLCSGTLINDSTISFTPYFFTANHCLDNDDADVAASKAQPAAVAATINTYWFFQTSVCGQDTANNVNFVLVAGGAKLLGRGVDFDWILLRLNNAPPAGATFAAWNASPLSEAGTAAAGIHHPEGDLKKISQGTTQGFQTFGDGSSFIGMQWTQGATEPGSSGSGLFTYNPSQNYYELRGSLYGGNSACDARSQGATDVYSRLDVALPMLRQYLTPNAANSTKQTLVVEYYYAGYDDYFITANQAEIQALDNGAHPGWQRTGLTFLAYSDPSVAPAGASPVCRFYVLPQAGDSHFYSADPAECAATAIKFAGTWVEESPALFYIQLPNPATGACPPNTRAIFRFLNNVNGLHHRYTAEVDVRDSIIQDRGWTQEGYGNPPSQTVMCSPTS